MSYGQVSDGRAGTVLSVRIGPRTRPSGDAAAVKVDARSERWREHRKKVRAEIVDAAFRSIDRLGPELSLREIAEEAGTAKPKIYRHFTDKSDLFQAGSAPCAKRRDSTNGANRPSNPRSRQSR